MRMESYVFCPVLLDLFSTSTYVHIAMIIKNLVGRILLLVLCLGIESAFAASTDTAVIRNLSFPIMFNPELDQSQVDTLVDLCRRQEPGLTCEMDTRGNAIGAFAILDYPLSLDKLRETVTASDKAQIFKSAIYKYSRNLPQGKMDEFIRDPEGKVRFISNHEVNGKFLTRFTYRMRSELVKTPKWIFEREWTLGGGQQTRGVGGYINNISYFTILVPMSSDRTRRIIASWSDVGGDLPVTGKIKAKTQDIIDGIYVGDKDVREYFKIGK